MCTLKGQLVELRSRVKKIFFPVEVVPRRSFPLPCGHLGPLAAIPPHTKGEGPDPGTQMLSGVCRVTAQAKTRVCRGRRQGAPLRWGGGSMTHYQGRRSPRAGVRSRDLGLLAAPLPNDPARVLTHWPMPVSSRVGVGAWAGWLHNPCRLGGPQRFRTGERIISGPPRAARRSHPSQTPGCPTSWTGKGPIQIQILDRYQEPIGKEAKRHTPMH